MKHNLKLVCAAMIVLRASFTVQAAELPKLAVLSTSSDFAAMADLLSVELSTKGGIVLVEREQIQKVWREQELSGSQRQGFIKLGRILNADGLLLLERSTEGTNELLAVRLVAVKPGVVLAEHRFAMPLAQPADWAKSFAPQVEHLLPKLAVKAEEAVPISILNLRSSVSTSEGLALEQELTTLLQFRLAHEPAIFVLERQRMEELQAEKQLSAADPEPFWNGAYVLDGTINRDVISRTNVTINARLASSRGALVSLEVSGPREPLSTVVDDLTRKVLAAIGKAPTTWRPEAEAERFYEEASWDGRWGLWRQMIEAADASWTLGLHTRPVATHRIGSRGNLAYGVLGPTPPGPIDPFGLRPPPSPEALILLTKALEIYRDSFLVFAPGTNGPGKPDRTWSFVGTDHLTRTATALSRFNAPLGSSVGHEEELRRLREVAREVNGLLGTKGDMVGGRPPKEPPDFVTIENSLRCNGIWFDKPEDAIEFYKRLLDPLIYSSARRALLRAGRPLTAWSVTERQQLPSLWLGFLREMVASTNSQMRLDGLRLILEQSDDPAELERCARRFTDEAWSLRLDIFLEQGVDAPVEHVLNALVRRVEPWSLPLADKFQALEHNWLERFREARPDLSYEVWKEIVANFTNASARFVQLSGPRIAPRPEQVAHLLAELETIRREHRSRFDVTKCMEELRKVAGSGNQTTNSVMTPPDAKRGPGEGGIAKLTVSTHWSLENLEPPPKRSFGDVPRLSHMVWHHDRLWLETKTYRGQVTEARARPALVAVNPQTLVGELFEAPFEDERPPWDSPRTAVIENEPFVYTDGALWHQDAGREWHCLPVPVSGWAVPYAWGKRIVLSTDSSILEFEPKTAQVRILASTRRNPAVSALDRAIGFAQPPLAIWPGEQLCALIGGTVWTYEATKKDWVSIFAATNCGERLELDPTGLFYRQSGQCGPRMLAGLRPGSSLLEYYSWESMNPSQRNTQTPNYTPPLWVHPDGSRPHESKAAFDGPNVWVFPSPLGSETYKLSPDLIGAPGQILRRGETMPPPHVFFFDRRSVRGLELRVELAGAAVKIAKEFEAACQGWGLSLEFLPTAGGLAILICQGGHLLWIPKADLDNSLAEGARENPESQRLDFIGLRRFDRSNKGWLTDAERRTMRRDPSWLKEEHTALDAAMRAAVATSSAEWNALFAESDENGDGKLSSFELAAAVKAHPQVFSVRLRGMNGPLIQAIQPYDLNNDMMLDRPEFLSFLADPRPVAEVNRSVDWVTKFGLKPEVCDTNDDGILDSAERLKVNRLIREHLGAAVKRN